MSIPLRRLLAGLLSLLVYVAHPVKLVVTFVDVSNVVNFVTWRCGARLPPMKGLGKVVLVLGTS